jgi:hypothetical protein
MLAYKIFIPVTAQVDMFSKCVTKIPDKTKLVVMNNFVNPDIKAICRGLAGEGAEIIEQPWNPGVAPSFNIAMKRLDEASDNLDISIVLSPACLFTRSVEDWAERLEQEEAKEKRYYYNAPSVQFLSDMHCIAFTKKMYKEFGLWDENLQPYGYDDQDTQHRFGLMGIKTDMIYGVPRISQALGQGIATDARLSDHFQRSVGPQVNYYLRKWGGEFLSETYSRPFDNPRNDINYWKLEKENIAKLIL